MIALDNGGNSDDGWEDGCRRLRQAMVVVGNGRRLAAM
jgi:hypothetical protein